MKKLQLSAVLLAGVVLGNVAPALAAGASQFFALRVLQTKPGVYVAKSCSAPGKSGADEACSDYSLSPAETKCFETYLACARK